MKRCKLLLNHILLLLREDKLKNDSVEDQILSINNKRMMLAGFIGILLHISHVVLFEFKYIPTSNFELLWQKGVIIIHGSNAFILMAITSLAVYLKGKSSYTLLKKILETVLTIDILFVGIALVTIDQYVTTNITPLITICTIMGVLILKRPLITIFVYAVTYFVYYLTIGLYQTDSAILLSNRVNGITSVCIGLGISLIMWYTYRQNILQNRLIEKQKAELEKLAFYDSLTGLYNRRKWISAVNIEMEHINSDNSECSIILLDIDDFKRINDKFGHPIGDKVLMQVAIILKKELRATDKVARWGGEEFIILIPGTALSKAMIIAENLRTVIENELIMFDGFSINITASFGVACLSSKQDFTLTYKKADESLYQAKQRGRNRVECIDLNKPA